MASLSEGTAIASSAATETGSLVRVADWQTGFLTRLKLQPVLLIVVLNIQA
jgi:hypothetical protein